MSKSPIPMPLVIKEFPAILHKEDNGRESSWRFRILKRKTPAGVRTHLDIREYEANDRTVGFTQHGVYFTTEELPFVILNLQKALEDLRNGPNSRY